MRKVRFLAAAQTDYRDALAWYASRSFDAASDFAERIDDAIGTIRELPEGWPLWPGRGDVRVRLLRRYPYSIVYAVRPEHVVIVAIAHQKRRPGYWQSRRLPP